MNSNKNQHLLNLSFKGRRKYLHSSDILPALLNLTGPIENLSIKFHKPTSKILKAEFVELIDLDELRKTKGICILMTFLIQGNQKAIIVNETSQPVIQREPYNEGLVTYDSSISNMDILQKFPKSGGFIHRIVGLNKKLLNSFNGKHTWVVTQIDLKKAPVEPEQILLSLKRKIGNTIYQSTIIGDDQILGKIIFSKL